MACAIDWPARLAEHGRWLRTALYARLRDPQAVDDVMQDVSLAALSLRKSLDDPSRAGAWLYRVALRQALLYRRKLGRRERLVVRFSQTRGREADSNLDPLSLLLREERCGLVRDALVRLDAKDAEILLLKYTESWSGRELARRLGVSERCIEARLFRARQRLRDALNVQQAIEVLK
jgi:RNA polymerase sigma factor (sigma-70 family)